VRFNELENENGDSRLKELEEIHLQMEEDRLKRK
jgi:hypothetical protein